MKDYIPQELLRRWILTARHGRRDERRRAVKALRAFARHDADGAYRAVYGITPRVRAMRFGVDAIHPGGRVRGGGAWRTA